MLIAFAFLFICVVALSIVALDAAHRRVSILAAEHSFAQTRHGPFEYLSWGEGPPVLVVHGAGGGFDQSCLLAEAVGSDRIQFIAISRFGYLGSSMPETPSTAAQVEVFVDLLNALGIERVRILAMSGGVPSALSFAEAFSDRGAIA